MGLNPGYLLKSFLLYKHWCFHDFLLNDTKISCEIISVKVNKSEHFFLSSHHYKIIPETITQKFGLSLWWLDEKKNILDLVTFKEIQMRLQSSIKTFGPVVTHSTHMPHPSIRPKMFLANQKIGPGQSIWTLFKK